MKHMIIPDTQVAPGDDTDHLRWAGQYAVDKRPDVIIFIGDHWDMPSLSSYDVGKKSFEGRRVLKDIAAGQAAMDVFFQPIWAEQKRQRRNHKPVWKPRLVFLMGNHEHRITRAIENDAKLEGMFDLASLGLKQWGFEVHDFLEVVTIGGVAYSHYFTSGVLGRPVSNARLMLNKKHMSCVMGHVQDRDIAFSKRADGQMMTGLFVGIFYRGDQSYLSPQTNGSWAGVWMLHEVLDGTFDEMPVSLGYLEKRYR